MCFYMESNAAGMVRRLALKTRFSEMGWGSTPLLSAKHGRCVARCDRSLLNSRSEMGRQVRFLYLPPNDVGVTRKARERIATPFYAGSNPVTYSSCKKTTDWLTSLPVLL